MICRNCRHPFDAAKARCPACGAPNTAVEGVFQTSTVRISTAGADRVYHSLDEVPARLRTRLQKSTNSANSATILIADRRGRRELARTLKASPANSSRRVAQAIAGRRKVLLLLLFTFLAVLAFAVYRSWG